ncbi:MAG: hypothetical protein QOH01_2892 [Verrucomicrobiota bacterium]|jgi:hypothetical protein
MVMLVLVLLAIAALVIPFLVVVILTTILFTLCEPKTRAGAIACFAVPSLALLCGIIVWGSTIPLWRYAEPIMRTLSWPALALVCLGIITAGFSVAAIRRREVRSTHDGDTTSTI